NPVVVLWTAAVVLTAVLAVAAPSARAALKTVPLAPGDWAWVVGLALACGLAFEALKRVATARGARRLAGL
ncbi:MAG TPA: cation transporting ATPase C-terminal domain-containing protein, partial [Thermomicrobiales bacterium]|nr:cation transporting ATPase C-terminal domain-containing protein [Thermomicrobiales bacterium]